MYEKWAGGSPEAPGCNFEFKDTGDQRQTGRSVARAFLPANPDGGQTNAPPVPT
jgi:hypothetical protein